MRDIKKLVGLCVCLMMVISGSIAMAHDDGDGETKGLKSKESEGLCYGTALEVILARRRYTPRPNRSGGKNSPDGKAMHSGGR
jgi:hypothetical protein